MAQKTYNARVKWKRDTSANWTSNDPVLLDGEIIIVDTSSGETRFKVGDGTKRYNQLPFEDEAVRSLISAKVDKVSGKELSSNDYTDAEKSKLAGIAAGANKTTVDSALSSTSTNPVQNRVINSALAGKAASSHTHSIANVSGLQSALDGKAASGHTHAAATDGSDGFMASEDKAKLDGIASGANKYTHPSYTSRSSGLYKLTVDSTGHISAASAVTKADIVALGIPGQDTNTTYGNASSSSAGLMSAADKAKLDSIASGANKTTVDSTLSSTSTNPVQNKVVNNALSGKAASNHSHSNATSSADGFMASEDKAKLDGVAAGANKYVHPTTSGNKHIPSGGSSGQILRWSADGTAAWGADNNTTYSNFKGASTSAAGGSGLVPAPAQGSANRYLRSDGTWQVPPDTNTTYSVATSSSNGLMSAGDKSKLDGIASGANKYTHPSYTARNSGLYKMTVDATGHVSAVTAVTKADITALGIPGQDTNTTYGVATTSANGLMSASDKTKLNGIATGANNYVHPTSAGYKHIPPGGSSGQILRWSSDGVAKWDVAPNGTVYTCAETLTGDVWIDGRPIYCKTFRGSQLTNGGETVIGMIEGVGEVVRFDGYIQRVDSDTIMPLNYSYYNNAQQMCSVNLRNDGAVRVQKGTAWTCKTYVVAVFYTKAEETPARYYLPFLFSPNEQGCALTASSEYSAVYQVEYAFNGQTNNYWACANNDSQRWVQVQMPYALRNMVVKLVNPQGSSAVTAANAPVSGAFRGSNNGSSWAALGSYSGRSTAAGSVTTHSLNNSTGYKYLRISITSPGASSGVWTGFGDIRIEGEVAWL